MEIAIIGFPQGGKTTLFRALTRGRADIIKPEKVTPAEVKYWDVPAGTGDARDGAGIDGQNLKFFREQAPCCMW